MLYLSQMTGKPVVDATGEKIGTISDLAISTGEVFPRITSLAFQGPGKVPFMISWRKYVGKFDEDGIERAIIRDLSTLLPESQAVIREALAEYYLIPKITRVNDATERYGIKWWVETDRGPCEFQIRLNTDIKVFYDNRVLIRDVNDNRYEIPDYTKLDKHSLHVLGTQI